MYFVTRNTSIVPIKCCIIQRNLQTDEWEREVRLILLSTIRTETSLYDDGRSPIEMIQTGASDVQKAVNPYSVEGWPWKEKGFTILDYICNRIFKINIIRREKTSNKENNKIMRKAVGHLQWKTIRSGQLSGSESGLCVFVGDDVKHMPVDPLSRGELLGRACVFAWDFM